MNLVKFSQQHDTGVPQLPLPLRPISPHSHSSFSLLPIPHPPPPSAPVHGITVPYVHEDTASVTRVVLLVVGLCGIRALPLALSERGDILSNATLRYCGCEARGRGRDIGRALGGRGREKRRRREWGRLKGVKGKKWHKGKEGKGRW